MHVTDRQTDRQMDGQTDRILIARPRLHSMQRGKNHIDKMMQKKYVSDFVINSEDSKVIDNENT